VSGKKFATGRAVNICFKKVSPPRRLSCRIPKFFPSPPLGGEGRVRGGGSRRRHPHPGPPPSKGEGVFAATGFSVTPALDIIPRLHFSLPNCRRVCKISAGHYCLNPPFPKGDLSAPRIKAFARFNAGYFAASQKRTRSRFGHRAKPLPGQRFTSARLPRAAYSLPRATSRQTASEQTRTG
jgi:hypothetical protein